MSMQYPVLDNRPIDQWKVTELREELRRRKLTTKGLKEELVKRLDEAIHNEKQSGNEEELNNGLDPDSDPPNIGNEEEVELVKEELNNGLDPDSDPHNIGDEEEVEPVKEELNYGLDPDSDPRNIGDEEEVEPVAEDNTDAVSYENEKTGAAATMIDTDDSIKDVNQGAEVEAGDTIQDACLDGTVAETVVHAVSMENNQIDNRYVVAQFDSSGQDMRHDEKHEDSESSVEDAAVTPSEPNNLLPEVSPDLGFQENCESISTDPVLINEKNKLKDNLNADNFHLELEVVKPEMVQPASNSVLPIFGDLHPLDDDKGLGKDLASLEEIDIKYASSVEASKKDDSADVGSPEKLNLDRSSSDESMEEDVPEIKLMESNSKSNELGERVEVIEEHAVGEGRLVDAVASGFSPDKKDIVAEEKMRSTDPTEKRKHEDLEVKVDDSSKRQRRWNQETIKITELQSSNISSSSSPKDARQPKPRHAFARSDSTLSTDTPKERVVPPSQKPATNSLRIDRFLRPFTLKAVQELLAQTGTVCNFWMDQIKTHCYVTYSSVEEAVTTRSAVYNLQWPPNGGRLLVAEFVDPQEVKVHAEAPQSPASITPSPTTPTAHPFQQAQASKATRQHSLRQQLPPQPPLPPPPPLSDPPTARERLPPPPPLKKPEPPVVTLDDLFKKTRATPRIYYLPLSEAQVTTKLAVQGNEY